VGILALEMLNGEPPYQRDFSLTAMAKIAMGPPPVSDAEKSLSQDLQDFCRSCLMFSVADRPTVDALLEVQISFLFRQHLADIY
jgi:p21-activated kinase 1